MVKLVFLILLCLVIIRIVMGGNRVEASAEVEVLALKPVKIIDGAVPITGNEFWSADYDYKISSQLTITSSSSLSIENGARILIIDNGGFVINNGAVLNIGSSVSDFILPQPQSSSQARPIDFLAGVNNSSGGTILLALADGVFASSVYKSSNILNTKIEISGSGYNHVFALNGGAILNARKVDISGVQNTGAQNGVYNDIKRTIFGSYTGSKLNLFEVNVNNIRAFNYGVFYAGGGSRTVIYKSNINGFVGQTFAGLYNGVTMNVFDTKINNSVVDKVFNVSSLSTLNFQKSAVSATQINILSSSSGTCITGFGGTTVNVSDSDIGPCFMGFSFYGTGNFKVNKNNLTGNGDAVINFSTGVDVSNNWWGSATGPKPADLSSLDPNGYSTADYIRVIANQNAIHDFKGTVTSTPFASAPFRDSLCCSSVLFIPGIQASRLYKKGLLGMENQLWEPNRNKDVESLFLNSVGKSVNSNIYTMDIITKTNFLGPLGSLDIYQSVIDVLSKEKTDGNISDFQTLAYDWRFLPSNILSGGIKTDSYTLMLKDKIKEMAKKSTSGKIIIVAHSYGGLLAKALVEELEKEGLDDKIESVVLVAVPEYGTPQSIPAIFYGDNEDLLGGLILSKSTAVSLAKNMPSAHLLLPSPAYFTHADGIYDQQNIINLDTWTANHFKLGLTKYDSFPRVADFLKNMKIASTDGMNAAIFDTAGSEHDLIDNYSSGLSSKTYSIVGVGIPTLSGMTYVKPKCRGFFFCAPIGNNLPDFTRKYSLMGDGVVIAHNFASRTGSVFAVDIGKENEVKKTAPLFFREDAISHKDIFRSSGVKDILHAILSRSKKESEMVNSFGQLQNPYVSYVSGLLSKPGPILGSYGNSSILSGISKIAEDATDADFTQRFKNSKILIVEAYGPLVLKTNFKNISDLQSLPFEQLGLQNRIINSTKYSDNNKTGLVSVVSCVYSNCEGTADSFFKANVYGQGGGVGTAQIVLKIDNKEIIYPNISVTPSTGVKIDYSTTTISIDNNADGTADKTIVPIQINIGTSTDSDTATSSKTVEDLFAEARAKLLSFGLDTGPGASSSSSTVSISIGTTSTYLISKYIDKLDVAERKYQKAGILQSLNILKPFYNNLELNMGVISNYINTYNKEQGFYSLNNFSTGNKRIVFLTQRQKQMREEILAYTEIYSVFTELIQGLGEGL